MNHGKCAIQYLTKVVVIAILLCTGCAPSEEKNEGILPQDQFREVLLDIHLAEAKALDQSYDEDSVEVTLKGDYLFIFESHGIDRETFFQSFDYYSDHPRQLADVYAEIHARLSVMQDSLVHH